MLQFLWEKVWLFLKGLNIGLPYEPAIPLLSIYLRSIKIYIHTQKMFIVALFIVLKKWKQSKCPSTDKLINKMWYIHTMKYYSAKNITKYYSAIKRNDTSYNMDEP